MANAVNVVPVIDTSASMEQYGYVEITKRDTEAFVSYCLPKDGLGVVNFDTAGHITYPFSIVDKNLTQVKDATEVIKKLSFNGNATAIGLGLQAADSMLKSRANPRGIVLLTDGYNNDGPDPLTCLPSGYPVYTCAMGLKADDALLTKIADKTRGKFYRAPFPSTMMKIFNEIRGTGKEIRIVVNSLDKIEVRSYALIPAEISGGNSALQVGVVWDDSSLSYTNSSSPSASQISVTLVEPDAQISGIEPRLEGGGYVVFDLPSPKPGQWYVQVVSGSASPTQVTCGVFEFPANQEGAAELIVSAPASIQAGGPLSVQAHVVENGEPVHNLQVRVEVVQPTLSVSNALKVYKGELEKVELTEEDSTRGVPEDLLRLARLSKKLLPERDILAHRSYTLILREGLESKYGASLEDTHQSGSYNIQVVATGRSPETGTRFQRTRLVTVLVTD
jgi:hypothetical protein